MPSCRRYINIGVLQHHPLVNPGERLVPDSREAAKARSVDHDIREELILKNQPPDFLRGFAPSREISRVIGPVCSREAAKARSVSGQ
jgi:hypothetical protein